MFFQFTTKDAGMGDEQAEVIGNARDVFRTECVLDVAAVTRVTALSDLTHDGGGGRARQTEAEKFTVLANLVTVVEGEVTVLTNLVAELRRQGSPEV